MDVDTNEAISADENAIRERLVEKVLARSSNLKKDDIDDAREEKSEKGR